MTLKSDYYDGLTGLHHTLMNAFAAGEDFIGSGVLEVSSLDFGDRSGTNLAQVGTPPGYYWDISSPQIDYRVWYQSATEVAPATAGRTLIPVAITSGDTTAQVAAKTLSALNNIPNTPFDVQQVGGALLVTNTLAGSTSDVSVGTLGGLAVAAVVTQGVGTTGNYTALQTSLKNAAAQGSTNFTVSLPTNYNAGYLRANNGNNLLRKAYFAGIQQALASSDIYNYECSLALNVSDSVNTKVDLIFNFATT